MEKQTFSLRYFRNFRVPVSKTDKIEMRLEVTTSTQQTQVFETKDLSVLNVSLSGVALKSKVKIAKSDQVVAHITFHKTTVSLPGIIVRSEARGGEYYLGLEFKNDERALSAKFLQTFIDSFTTKRLKSHLISLLHEEESATALHSDDMFVAVLQILEEFSKYREIPGLGEALISATKKRFELEDMSFIENEAIAPFIVYNLQGKVVGSLVVKASLSELSTSRRRGLEALCQLIGFIYLERESGIHEESVRFLQPTAPRRYVMIGSSLAVNGLRETVSKTKFNHSSVYISGEFGVGKTLMAKIIHSESVATDETFRILDLGQIHGQAEISSFFSELDQHAEGTLVLREIQMAGHDKMKALGLELAKKRWHQKWRVVTTAQCSLEELCQKYPEAKFLSTLAQIKIEVPSLASRREDIAPLLSFFLKRECLNRGLRPKLMTNDLVQYVMHSDFENNIYALKQFVSRMVELNTNAKILTFDDGHRLGLLEDEHFQLSQFERVLAQRGGELQGRDQAEIMAEYYQLSLAKAWDESKGDTKLAMIKLGIDDEKIIHDYLKEKARKAA